MNMGDIAYYNLGERKTDAELNGVEFNHTNQKHYNVVPRLNKLEKIPNKTSWDSFAYALMMGHNVECHIVAVQRAQQLMDIECAKFKPNWRMKGIEGKKEKEYSDWVPNRILYFSSFVEELFNTSTKDEAFRLISDAAVFLKTLEGSRLQGGPAQNTFNILFEDDHTRQSEIDFTNPDDNKLRGLEEAIVAE
jgi:hypothetical protein